MKLLLNCAMGVITLVSGLQAKAGTTTSFPWYDLTKSGNSLSHESQQSCYMYQEEYDLPAVQICNESRSFVSIDPVSEQAAQYIASLKDGVVYKCVAQYPVNIGKGHYFTSALTCEQQL